MSHAFRQRETGCERVKFTKLMRVNNADGSQV